MILLGFTATSPWRAGFNPTKPHLIVIDHGRYTLRDLETGVPISENWATQSYLESLSKSSRVWEGKQPDWVIDPDLQMDEGL